MVCEGALVPMTTSVSLTSSQMFVISARFAAASSLLIPTVKTADRCPSRITARELSPAVSPMRCSSLLVVVTADDNFVVDDLDDCWFGDSSCCLCAPLIKMLLFGCLLFLYCMRVRLSEDKGESYGYVDST